MVVPVSSKLPDDLTQCHELIVELANDIARYQKQIDYLSRRLFGRRSEKISGEELDFFGHNDLMKTDQSDRDVEPNPTETPEVTEKKKRRRRKTPQRPTQIKDLPRRRVEYDVTEEQRCCEACGVEKRRIGEEVSEQLEFVPACYHVIEHIRPKYAYPCCQGQVVIAEKPAQPIEKGMAGPGLIAHVLVSKYADHLPLYRQEKIMERHGVHLSRKTLCDWVLLSAALLEPVVQVMHTELLKSFVVHSDDTSVPVQTDGKTHKGYLWVYIGDREHPYTVYDFTWTRSRAGPQQFLAGYEGYLQADAYAGYDQLYAEDKVREVGCWAHARRKFYDAKVTAAVQANEALLKIKDLYQVEREVKDLDDEQRRGVREEKARPLLEAMKAWLDELQIQILPKSPLGEAIGYALNHWTALTRYLDDGRLAIDNNISERALRPVVIGRKNYLFTGSQRGGRAAAIHYSLIQSAKHNGVEPFAYLRDLLIRIPTHPYRRIHELLPDQWENHNPVKITG